MGSLLNEYGVAEILITLLDNPGIYQGELEEKVTISRYKIINLIQRLVDNNLVVEERGKFARKYLRLTEKGEEVAKALKKAREALEKS